METILLSTIFVLTYFFIVIEHKTGVNKAAIVLLGCVAAWATHFLMAPSTELHHFGEQLTEKVGEIAGLLFFLLGAMTIIELMDAHDAFGIITSRIKTKKPKLLLIIVTWLAFILSAIIDNMTTAIVMAFLLKCLVKNNQQRMLMTGVVVIAANAGGAWTPIGDVTTTMLWIANQLSTLAVIKSLFVPSVACTLIPMLLVMRNMKGAVEAPLISDSNKKIAINPKHSIIMLVVGLGTFLFTPIFKTITHLPPFFGILCGLGALWVISEIIHKDRDEKEKTHLGVAEALKRVDTPSVLFFLGILLVVATLDVTGILRDTANSTITFINQFSFIEQWIGAITLLIIVIGLLSAVVDNIPLVAACQAMFPLSSFPMDHKLWHFIAYCGGTGGSGFVIGSAAGVAVMGIEKKMNFDWYAKHISIPAFAGYFTGIVVYLLMHGFIK